MSHAVSANYTMPTILNTLKPNAAMAKSTTAAGKNAKATSTSSSASSTASSSSAAGVGSTFLSLLATELQNQDPTAPVDSTAMVGQMISLNQLDQLISINSTLTTSASTGTTGKAAQAAAAPASGASADNVASTLSPAAALAAAQSQLPFDPNTLMPLNSATGKPNALGSSINSATSGFPGFDNSTTTGGK
jgi:flagellar basal-body rod modification protein FlgD